LPPLTWEVLSKIPIVAAAMAGLFGTLAWSLNRRESLDSQESLNSQETPE
jgi:hypothetical protein